MSFCESAEPLNIISYKSKKIKAFFPQNPKAPTWSYYSALVLTGEVLYKAASLSKQVREV